MMVGRHKIAGAGIVKQIVLTRSGRSLLTNSSDRTLRQFEVPNYPNPAAGLIMEEEIEPIAKLNDPINRMAWNGMAYSPDGEWAAGGAADPAAHKIYIWDLSSNGQFTTALDGGREVLIHLDWHPSEPCIVSTTKLGDILVWHCPSAERWGAFAGGFEEVDENVEYDEREDEFDIEDETEQAQRKMKEEEEFVNVDENWIEQKGGSRTLDQLDEDSRWADEDGDEDNNLNWEMPVLMEEEE